MPSDTRLEPLSRPEPAPRPVTHLRWCLTVGKHGGGRVEHCFTSTNELIFYLSRRTDGDPAPVKLELEGPEEVSDVVAFFGTPVRALQVFEGDLLQHMIRLVLR